MADDDHEQMAREFLRKQLGPAAPAELTLLGRFNERVLEGEGPVSIFSFQAAIGGTAPETYHVVAGQTEPNYYPAWSLSPDELYSLHLGTRFMLVMSIARVPLEELPPDVEQRTREMLAKVAPGEAVTDFKLAAAFSMEGQKHAVARCRIADEDVYVLCADLPPGIYRYPYLPPNVVYRLHLGNVIRREESL